MKTRRGDRPLSISTAGFTLVELMIALALGSLLTLALMGFFVYGNRSYQQDDRIAKLQDELRFGMTQITRDLEMAGFWDSILEPDVKITLDASLTLAGDCGPAVTGQTPGTPAATWIYGNRSSIAYLDDATPAEVEAAFPCITAAEFPAISTSTQIGNPDVVAIKRLASELSYEVLDGDTDLLGDGNPATPAGMPQNQIFLQSTGDAGILFRLGSVVPTDADGELTNTPYKYWRYRPTIYFIRNYTQAPGDGIPSLCRKVLALSAGTPSMTAPESTECLATGIEDLQLEYGIDTDSDAAPNYYVSAPALSEMTQLAAVRITLLARSEQEDRFFEDRPAKTFTLSTDKEATPVDGFNRRMLSTTVLLRNPAAQGMLQ